MTEEWRPVVGYEGSYEVSSLGRVASLPKRNQRGRRIRAARIASTGYRDLSLWSGGKAEHFKIATLVATAFHGLRPDDADLVRHLNGDRLDDRASNLRWGTWSENNSDTVRHGRHYNAIKTQCKYGHELTEANVYRHGGAPGKRWCMECRRNRDAVRIRDRRKVKT